MWRFNNHQDDERFVRRVRIIAVYAVGVIIVALLATFLIYRYEDVASLVDSVMTPIRPVIFGLIIAYLLSPVQNSIQSFLEIRLRRFKFGKTLSRILGEKTGERQPACINLDEAEAMVRRLIG